MRKNGQTGLVPLQKELLFGSKVFGIWVFSLEKVEKDAAGIVTASSLPYNYVSLCYANPELTLLTTLDLLNLP